MLETGQEFNYRNPHWTWQDDYD